MKRWINFLSCGLIITLIWSSIIIQPASAQKEEDTVRVLIKYKNGQMKTARSTLNASGAVIRYVFNDINTLALTISEKDLPGLDRKSVV